MKLESLHPEVRDSMYRAFNRWSRRQRGSSPPATLKQCWEAAWLACLDSVADKLAPHGLTL